VKPLRVNPKYAWWFLAVWIAGCCSLFSRPLLSTIRYALANDNSSHILLVPFIVGWLLYLDRRKLIADHLDLRAALVFALPASFLVALGLARPSAISTLPLTVWMLGFVLLVVAGFAALFAGAGASGARFPLLFLLFFIPIPDAVLNKFIHSLQAGSAAVAGFMFDCTGIPALREGFVFRLPTMSIEVAPECSGIRSSMALVILAVLVSHFAFSKLWKKTLFVAAGLLMMIVKNGIRIATLTILANYVDPDFLYGRLHHQGGVVFFLIGLGLLLPVYLWLRRGEPSLESRQGSPAVAET